MPLAIERVSELEFNELVDDRLASELIDCWLKLEELVLELEVMLLELDIEEVDNIDNVDKRDELECEESALITIVPPLALTGAVPAWVTVMV